MNVNNESLTNLRLRHADLTRGIVGLFATVRMEQVEDGPNVQDLADNVTSTLEELGTAIEMLPDEVHTADFFDPYEEQFTVIGNRRAIQALKQKHREATATREALKEAQAQLAKAEVIAQDARLQLHTEQERRIAIERDLQRALGYLDRVNDDGAGPRRNGPQLEAGRVNIGGHDYARDVDDCGRPSVTSLIRNGR